MERQQHANPDPPVFSVLHLATSNPKSTPATLTAQLGSESGIQIDEPTVQKILPEARTLFAQLVADEVAETLEKPTSAAVKREISQLGLGKAFNGVALIAED